MLVNGTLAALPSPQTVGILLTGIIGRPVLVQESDPAPAPASYYCGIYRDDLGAPLYACLYDLSLAAHAGAALLLLPPARAQHSLEAGELDSAIDANVRDILHRQAQIFQTVANRHIHLAEVLPRTGELPDRIRRLIPVPEIRADFETTIHGYGVGTMAIVRLEDPMNRMDDLN